jgi:DNA mismatch repair protein MutL
MADFFKSAPPPQPHLSFPEVHGPRGGSSPPDRAERFPLPLEHSPPPAAPNDELPRAPAIPQAPPSSDAAAFQVNDSYIVSQCGDGLIIVDQHALHERVIYNDLKARLASGPLTAQRMLIPQTVTVTAAEADLLAANEDLLAKLGVEVAPFGPETVAIQQFPMLLADRGVHGVEFLRDVLDKLGEDSSADPEQLIEGVLQVMACKAAIKAGQPLSGDEIKSLIARADDAEKSSSCPHGRPTTLKLTLQDLEKQFKRT